MREPPFRVLFLCTGNSARSILAECILNRLGMGRFLAFSAGSHPTGMIHPLTIVLLQSRDYPSDKLRSKSWNELAPPASTDTGLDFIFTVCANAADEKCPIWPGHPVSAHWGVADPAAVRGSRMDRRAAFMTAYRALSDRIEAFIGLPFATLDGPQLQSRLDAIGDM